MNVIIDADSLLYKACFVAEEKVDINMFSDGEVDSLYYSSFEDVARVFDTLTKNLLNKFDAEDTHELVFSSSSNFRYNLGISYKANRKKLRKPFYINELKEYALLNYKSIQVDNIEADDYVVYKKNKIGDDILLLAVDKDVLYQSVGKHYNYNKQETVIVTKKEAIKYKYFQALTGDTSDGYKGCPRVGPAKATKILEGLDNELDIWNAVKEAYRASKTPIETAVKMMQLADMTQFKGDKVVLWTPESIGGNSD